MVKKSYGCSILVVGILGVFSWMAYEEVNHRLAQFEVDAKSLVGAGEPDARSLLGDANMQISYRDSEAQTHIEDLMAVYSGIETRKVEYRALIYLRFRRCAVIYIDRTGRITDVDYGEVES